MRLKRKARREKEAESQGQPTEWRMKLAAELNRVEVEPTAQSYTYVTVCSTWVKGDGELHLYGTE